MPTNKPQGPQPKAPAQPQVQGHVIARRQETIRREDPVTGEPLTPQTYTATVVKHGGTVSEIIETEC